MNDSTQQLLLFGATLFTLGMVGFLTRRSMILMFLSMEMMLAGVTVNLIAFSRQHQNYQGQVMAIMVLTVAACEAAIALALVVSLYRRKATLDVNVWSELRETQALPISETRIVLEKETLEFPKLTPAGLDPLVKPMSKDLEASNGFENGQSRRLKTEASPHA